MISVEFKLLLLCFLNKTNVMLVLFFLIILFIILILFLLFFYLLILEAKILKLNYKLMNFDEGSINKRKVDVNVVVLFLYFHSK